MYDDLNNHTQNGNYYDTNGGYIHYDSSSNLKEQKKKKKGGFGKTVARCLVLALVFGSVASISFMGTNYLGRQMFGDEVTIERTEEKDAGGTVTPTTTVAGTSSDVYDVSDLSKTVCPRWCLLPMWERRSFGPFLGLTSRRASPVVPALS